MDLLVEVKTEGEDHIVGAERLAIGETQSATKRQRVFEPVAAD